MNNLKKSVKQNAYNEDELLSKLYQRAQSDGLRSQWVKPQKESFMKKRTLWFIGLVTVVVLGVLVANSGTWFNDKSNITVATISIDINPSFELSVNEDCDVISIEALNADAQTIDTSSLIGLPIGKAVNDLVDLVSDAGFIDLIDMEDDFVVVTKYLEDGTSETIMDKLDLQIKDQIRDGSALQSVNVIELKASIAEKMEAEGKDVPIGLYILHGMVSTPDGTVLSAKEFFAKEGNLEAVMKQTRAQITTVNQAKIRERIEVGLGKLESNGEDATELRTRLENASEEDMLRIQSEIKAQLNAQEGNGNPDNGTDDSGNPDSGNPDSGSSGKGDTGGQSSGSSGGGSGS